MNNFEIVKDVQAIDGHFREYRLTVDKESNNNDVRWIPPFSIMPSYEFDSLTEVFSILDEFEGQFCVIPSVESDKYHIYYSLSEGDRTLIYFGTIKE